MSYTPATLFSLAIFNATFSTSEDDEHEKILFYFPDTLGIERQIRNVGLMQGLINFTRSFSPTKPCESVHTNKRTQSLLEAEPEYWVVLTINNPSVKKNNSVRYKEDEISDEILKYITARTYTMFKLFHGSMTEIVKNQGVEKLRSLLTEFYKKYIPLITFEDVDVFDSLEGIYFMPVDKNLYLNIVSFINGTNNSFPQIKEIVFFFKDHLVWSGLEQEDIRVLYRFLIKIVAIGNPDSDSIQSDFISINRGGTSNFLTGNVEEGQSGNVPEIFINDPPEKVSLILYKRKDITLVFLFDTKKPVAADTLKSLHQSISYPIDTLSPIISEYFTNRKQTSDDAYRYIYFNHMNLALKTSYKKGITLNKDTLRFLNQMHTDFARNGDNMHEQIINAGTNKWLVGKKSENREVYLIFEDKKTNLNDVSEELRKLHSTLFNNLFIDC